MNFFSCENATGLFDLLTVSTNQGYLFLNGLTDTPGFTLVAESPSTLIFLLICHSTSVTGRRQTAFRKGVGLNPKVNAGLM